MKKFKVILLQALNKFHPALATMLVLLVFSSIGINFISPAIANGNTDFVFLHENENGQKTCDGRDDTSALAKAIAKASLNGGNTVVLPNATCQVSATVVLPSNVRLVGGSKRSQIAPISHMDSLIRVTGGQSSIENLTLQNSSSLVSIGVEVRKSDDDTLPTTLSQINVIGFSSAIEFISGHSVIVTGGLYLNNNIAFRFIPVKNSITNMVITGGTLVQGGSGVDLQSNITGKIYPHVEGLLISDLQVIQGVNNGFCLRLAAGVHIVWRGGMCAEARTGGFGFQLIDTADRIRSVDIGNVFIGANPNASGTMNGISIKASADQVKVHQVHLSSWKKTPIVIDGVSGMAHVSISMPSFDGTSTINDIEIARSNVTVIQAEYDVITPIKIWKDGNIISWPP